MGEVGEAEMSHFRCIICGEDTFRLHGIKYCEKCGNNKNYIKEYYRKKNEEMNLEFHRKWVKN